MIFNTSPCLSIFLSHNTFYSISKRFFGDAKKPYGHVHAILNKTNQSTFPITLTTRNIFNNPKTIPEIKEVPFTEIKLTDPNIKQENNLQFNQVNEQISNKTLIVEKMKHIVACIVPSYIPQSSSQTLTSQQSMLIQGKEALHFFLNYFEKLPEDFIKNPDFFLLYHKELTEKNPMVFVRAYQLALEIYYRKRQFTENEICNLFENKIILEDIIGRNKNIADIGTIFSLLQANYLYTQPGFAENINAATVLATCINSNDLKNLPSDILNRMENIRRMTGNTLNDIDLNGHPHDFKISYTPSYSKNHIIFMPSIENNFAFDIVAKQISGVFQQALDIMNKANDNSFKKEYLMLMLNKLNIIQKEKASDIEKYYAWNYYLFKNMHTRPQEITTPIFIPLQTGTFKAHTAFEKPIANVALTPKKVLQAPDVTKAIMGVTTLWPRDISKKAFQDTDGLLGKDDVD